MDINQVGLLIAYKRINSNISVKELCEGVCSRSYLEMIELGERSCEKIMAETFLQRLGFASDQFLYFLDTEEERLLKLKEGLVQVLEEGNAAKAEEYAEKYRQATKGKSKLHEQFLGVAECVMQWNTLRENQESILAGLEQKLLEAWNITRKGYPLDGECPNLMSFTELFIKSLYLRIQEELGKQIKAIEGYKNLLLHIEKKFDIRDSARIYPQITYRLLRLLASVAGTEEEQEKLYQNCMELLISEGEMVKLCELSEYRREVLLKKEVSERNTEEIEILEELVDSLRWLYKTYNVKTRDWFSTLPIGREEVFPLAETLRNRRLAFGWTQEQLAAGICDPVTISRIENGWSKCQKDRLGMLMDKLHLPGGTAFLSVQTGSVDTYEIVAKINQLSKFARHKEARPFFEQLKGKVVHDRYVDQFLVLEEATIQNEMGELDVFAYWKKQKEALYITLPEKEPEELERWVFTRTEAMIINALSYGCKRNGKVKEAILWLHLARNYYEKQSFHGYHYLKGYELTLRNLGNLLGEVEKYEKAMEYEDVAIRLELESETASLLRLLVYDRGWNMEQMWKNGTYTKDESRPYIKAARVLNHLYAKPESAALVEKHWERFYAE